jgi:hypothetical protein
VRELEYPRTPAKNFVRVDLSVGLAQPDRTFFRRRGKASVRKYRRVRPRFLTSMDKCKGNLEARYGYDTKVHAVGSIVLASLEDPPILDTPEYLIKLKIRFP